jgi:excinuclease ABC subunit C
LEPVPGVELQAVEERGEARDARGEDEAARLQHAPGLGQGGQAVAALGQVVERAEKEDGVGGRFREVELPLNSPGLMLLRKLRDEAHRFALSYHRKLRDKRMQGSALEEVPGVGPRRRRLLLRTFGSVDGIRKASVEELAAVPTMTKAIAAKVKDYLQEA